MSQNETDHAMHDVHRSSKLRIFVTGGNGFVGRRLLPALVQAGYKVCALSRSTSPPLIAKVDWIQGELTQPGSWEDRLGSTDAIIHLASIHEASAAALQRTNVVGTEKLLRVAQIKDVQRIIYLSTITAVNNPRLPYSYSAWQAENLITQSPIDFTILRATVIVGAGDPFLKGLISMAKRWPFIPIFGSGNARFQPLWVDDTVSCIRGVLLDAKHSKRIIPIGGPEVLTFENIIDLVQNQLQTRKRKIHLPRRWARAALRLEQTWGIRMPFIPAYFLKQGLVAHPETAPDDFGFQFKSLAAILPQIVAQNSPET
jgi:NADH dehydrogenase